MKEVKKMGKGMISLTGASLIGGAGSTALGKMGGSVAASGQLAIGRVSSFFPVMGSLVGTKAVVGSLSSFNKTFQPKKRRKR